MTEVLGRVVEINTMIWAALGTMLQHIPLLPFYVRIWSCVPPNYTVPTSCATMCSAQTPPPPVPQCPLVCLSAAVRPPLPIPFSCSLLLSPKGKLSGPIAQSLDCPPPPLDLLPSTSCLPRHLRELQSPPLPLPCSLSLPLLPPSLLDRNF